MTETLENLLRDLRSLATAQGLVDDAWIDSILSVLPPAIRTRLPHPDAPGDRLEQVFARLAVTGPTTEGMTPLVKVGQRLALEPSADIVAAAQKLLDHLAQHPIEVRPVDPGDATDTPRASARIVLRGVPKNSNVIVDFKNAVGDDLQDITITISAGSVVITLEGPRARVLAVAQAVLDHRGHPMFRRELLSVSVVEDLAPRVLYQAAAGSKVGLIVGVVAVVAVGGTIAAVKVLGSSRSAPPPDAAMVQAIDARPFDARPSIDAAVLDAAVLDAAVIDAAVLDAAVIDARRPVDAGPPVDARRRTDAQPPPDAAPGPCREEVDLAIARKAVGPTVTPYLLRRCRVPVGARVELEGGMEFDAGGGFSLDVCVGRRAAGVDGCSPSTTLGHVESRHAPRDGVYAVGVVERPGAGQIYLAVSLCESRTCRLRANLTVKPRP